MNTSIDGIYLKPTNMINFNNEVVVKYAEEAISGCGSDPVEIAKELYYKVRDEIIYNPYVAYHLEDTFKASNVISSGKGYCVSKASLLCALGRYCKIPSRLGFATVINHIVTRQLADLMGSNKFVYHGFTEFYLNGKWVKATPAFDLKTCEKHSVDPLEFNGLEDSINQEFDRNDNRFMNYIEFTGHYADVPVKTMIAGFRKEYGDELVDKWIGSFDNLRGISRNRFDTEEVVK